MTLIGISGKKRSGKDTVASILRSQYKGTSGVYGFATELKKEVSRACGVSAEYMDTYKEQFRPVYQWWGTEFRRKLFGEDYWIKKMAQALDSMSNLGLVIVPDVRFRNEYDFIKQRGGRIIRTERASLVLDSHASETSLDDVVFDYVVRNDSIIEDLINEVNKLNII